MELTPELLYAAYSQGIFPMADGGEIYWYDPDPRAIIPLNHFHVSRSLRRTIRKNNFEIRINENFSYVIEACAATGTGRESTWISPEIIRVYEDFHRLGFAYTVETWQNNELVGGLYGVAINGLFAGESMFSLCTDASKIALVFLVNRLRSRGFHLLDIQFMTEHLKNFGAIEIKRSAYKAELAYALGLNVTFID